MVNKVEVVILDFYGGGRWGGGCTYRFLYAIILPVIYIMTSVFLKVNDSLCFFEYLESTSHIHYLFWNYNCRNVDIHFLKFLKRILSD